MHSINKITASLVIWLCTIYSWNALGQSCSLTSTIVADNFSTASYNLNDGLQDWTSDWLESGESDGPNAGILRVNASNCSSGNCLRLGSVSGEPSSSYTRRLIYRETNLSKVDTDADISLQFNYRTGYLTGYSWVRLWVSSDGGSSWNLLQHYDVNGTNYSPTFQDFSITNYRSQNTMILFEAQGSSATTGFYVDDLAINVSRACSYNPVAQWHFDESGWGGTADEVIDYSGTGLNGYAVNGASTSPSGQVCRSATFDGVDDYVNVTGIHDYLNTTSTLSFWMKTSQAGDTAYWRAPGITGIEEANKSSNDIFWGYMRSTNLLGLGQGGAYHIISPSGSVSFDNTWQHIVLTRDSISGILQMYRNGVLLRSGQGLTGDVPLIFSSIGRIEDTAGTPGYFQGELDEMLIFDRVISQSEIQTIYNNQAAGKHWDGSEANCETISLGKFSISHDNNASYCLAEPLQVAAYSTNNEVMSDYAGSITLDTQTGSGTWAAISANGVFIDDVIDDGIATYTFSPDDLGIASFTLSYEQGDALINVDVYTGGIRDDDTEGDLSFSATGFSVTAAALSNPPELPIDSDIYTQVSGQAFNVHLAAYGTNPESGECGIIETYTGNKTINVSAQYLDPNVGALSPLGSGIIPFTNGQGMFSSRYDDVGKIIVSVTDTNLGIQGNSNQFVVKPSDFSISVESNPSTTDTGDGFMAAGEAFSIEVKALNALGNITPNFGNEYNPESVKVDIDTLVFPTGGDVGELSNSDTFTKEGDDWTSWVYCSAEWGTCSVPSSATVRYGKNGVYNFISGVTGSIPCTNSTFGNPIATVKECEYRLDYDAEGSRFTNSSISWNQVGSFRLVASVKDEDYLGDGNVTGSPSDIIGRFYPDSFLLNTSSIANSCNNFTYLSEPNLTVNYSLSAIGKQGNTLSNYDAGLAYPVGTISYGAELNNNGSDLSSRLIVDTTEWSAGDYILLDSHASFGRSNVLEAPFESLQLSARVDDIDSRPMNSADAQPSTTDSCSDAENCTHRSLGNASFYYGRLRLLDAYGPESANLPAAFTTEYWNGNNFVLNTNDSCTLVSRNAISFNNQVITANSALTVDLDGGSSTASFSNIDNDNIRFNNGDAGFVFSAPGSTINEKDIIVNVDVTTIDWLAFDWNQNNTTTDDDSLPTAIMSFKTYRGHDRILYWRHKY